MTVGSKKKFSNAQLGSLRLFLFRIYRRPTDHRFFNDKIKNNAKKWHMGLFYCNLLKETINNAKKDLPKEAEVKSEEKNIDIDKKSSKENKNIILN